MYFYATLDFFKFQYSQNIIYRCGTIYNECLTVLSNRIDLHKSSICVARRRHRPSMFSLLDWDSMRIFPGADTNPLSERRPPVAASDCVVAADMRGVSRLYTIGEYPSLEFEAALFMSSSFSLTSVFTITPLGPGSWSYEKMHLFYMVHDRYVNLLSVNATKI